MADNKNLNTPNNISNDIPNEQKKANVPNLRFSEFNKPWDKYKLKDISKRITRKNINNTSKLPLTISAQFGLINQEEFFDKQIASRDMSNYYLIQNGEFAYNKSYSNGYPWGAIKRLDNYDNGALSTLYICFKPNDNICSDYLTHYFETTKWYKGISDIAGEGARNHGLLNMSVKDFFDTKHYLPDIQEQVKIKDFLNLISRKVDTQSKIIEDLESQIKWIRYKIFNSQNIANHKLSDYLIDYSEKNTSNLYQPVAVGKYGIRKREDIYSKELASDYSKNKVIRKNTLIIGMGSTQIDIGILLDDEVFCVSPAYTTYKIKNINSFYLNEMLIYLNPLLSNKYMIISARQGKSVKKDELLAHSLYIHDIEIQNKIEKIFVLLYKRLNKEKDILMLYKKQKEYLLKNMFI